MQVQKDSFAFAGVDMLAAYGIRMVARDVLAPRLRKRLLEVPGRDGTYDFGARWYDDREVRLVCDSLRGLTRAEVRELAYLLSRKGELVLWDEPEIRYVGRLYDEAELTRVGRIGYTFELRFVCEPFALGETVQGAVGGRVQYEGTARTPVRLMVRNDGGEVMRGLRMRVRRRRSG